MIELTRITDRNLLGINHFILLIFVTILEDGSSLSSHIVSNLFQSTDLDELLAYCRRREYLWSDLLFSFISCLYYFPHIHHYYFQNHQLNQDICTYWFARLRSELDSIIYPSWELVAYLDISLSLVSILDPVDFENNIDEKQIPILYPQSATTNFNSIFSLVFGFISVLRYSLREK